ncbi:MAG: ribonuclease HII [Anaerolineales bacterium]
MIDAPGLHLERELWANGIQFIGGVDEAGRGALAGPVMAGVVILPNIPHLSLALSGVRDSKQMTPPQRGVWALKIKEVALAWAVGAASADEIDSIGILPATRLAVTRAIQSLTQMPDFLLMDYLPWPGLKNPHHMLPKGERHSLSIACASVLAKTERDSEMERLDKQYPGYSLSKHKGYGTTLHRAAIQTLGHSPIHRQTFMLHQYSMRDTLCNTTEKKR